MRKSILALVVGILLALPGASYGKARHGHKRAHVAKKAKAKKHTKLARKSRDVTPTSSVVGMDLPAAAPVAPEPRMAEPAPAPAPAASPVEDPLGHKVKPVTPNEQSNMATQATDDEIPGRKK